MNHYPTPAMDFHRSASNTLTTGHYYRFPAAPMAKRSSSIKNTSAEAQAVSEALLTLSSVASAATKTVNSSSVQSSSQQPIAPSRHRPAGAPRRVSLCSPAASYAPQWPQPFVPRQNPSYESPKRASSPAEDAPPKKKARTVSPINAPATADDLSCISCICPVCNQVIKGLGDQKVDWAQPIQGRQRAKTITAIKKHVKENHDESEPIWNIIVNSLEAPSRTSDDTQRVVTAQAFVHQALKKSALDSIPNQPKQLRSLRWTEKMIDQRVGIALGFVMYGGHEFLRGKMCTDENNQQINPKSLRNLAYSLIRGMHEELMESLEKNERVLQDTMNQAPLGLLRNRFQLLFAAPDKWTESWYMDPAKYSKC